VTAVIGWPGLSSLSGIPGRTRTCGLRFRKHAGQGRNLWRRHLGDKEVDPCQVLVPLRWTGGAPIFHPEQAADLPRLLSRAFQTLQPDLLRALMTFVKAPTPEAFFLFEQESLHILQVLGSHIAAGAVAYLHEDAAGVADSVHEARRVMPVPTRNRGWRNTRSSFWAGLA